jgi:hypothetical protein
VRELQMLVRYHKSRQLLREQQRPRRYSYRGLTRRAAPAAVACVHG